MIDSEDWARRAGIRSGCGNAPGLGETGWGDSVRFGPDQRRGLPMECLSCAADRFRADRRFRRASNSELARTKGIRLSN
ncbi:hypothetical protein AVEN_149584-1 [Araneus ventricosus]|uniref:Uncharacterized protein n=1 Tax=Araneus ventricosus TaxID=182803 RepID=A0A4Y2PIZ0_ARAVE|nr:hypothetical protein AVEN_149584-1 [Araneus ventricosus]